MPSSLTKIKYFLRETSSILLTGRSPPSASDGGRKRASSAQDSQEWRVGASSGQGNGRRRKHEPEGVCMTEIR